MINNNILIPIIVIIISFILIIFRLIIPRIKMLNRAKAILKTMPKHDEKILYLQFSSIFGNGKQKETDSKIEEMNKQGWVYLKASEANPIKTLCSLAGGVNMYFIRDISDNKSTNS